jgi:hypothetical protein
MGLQVVELAHPKFAYLERNDEKKYYSTSKHN